MKTMFHLAVLPVLLLASCAKEPEKHNAAISSTDLFAQRATLVLKARISSAQTATLSLNKNMSTGLVTVSKTLGPAAQTDDYVSYVIGLTPVLSGDTAVLHIPAEGTYYFIPFDDTENTALVQGATEVVYTCECCPTGGGGGCGLSGTAGPYFTVSCVSTGCTECGLNATDRPVRKTGVYLPATGVVIK